MIIVSGFNVYPNEVEAVAAACPASPNAPASARRTKRPARRCGCSSSRRRARRSSEADVIAHCRRELAAYKVPKQVRFLEALPKSNVGKILRKDLRDIP